MSKQTSGCIDSGHGCEAGNPRIGGLTEADLARIPAETAATFKAKGVDVRSIYRCTYCNGNRPAEGVVTRRVCRQPHIVDGRQ